MELYFETYFILSLLFAILIFYISGLYRKSKAHSISLSAVILFLGFVLPYFLILFQIAYGSLGEIGILELESYYWHEDISVEESMHIFGPHRPLVATAGRYFYQNLGLIIFSIVVGISIGLLLYFLMKKRKDTVK